MKELDFIHIESPQHEIDWQKEWKASKILWLMRVLVGADGYSLLEAATILYG